jgi:DDE superfamily endonuclease
VIRLEFGVTYHPGHGSRLCQAIRSSPKNLRDAPVSVTKPPSFTGSSKPGWPSKGAQAQQQMLLFRDESAFYPLPSVVRTYAPVGQTPILREWWTRDHLSAISALSPEGKLYFHYQDHAINSEDVVAFLEHWLREVPGRMATLWDGAPIHCSHTTQGFLTNGAAQRLHLERLQPIPRT